MTQASPAGSLAKGPLKPICEHLVGVFDGEKTFLQVCINSVHICVLT